MPSQETSPPPPHSILQGMEQMLGAHAAELAKVFLVELEKLDIRRELRGVFAPGGVMYQIFDAELDKEERTVVCRWTEQKYKLTATHPLLVDMQKNSIISKLHENALDSFFWEKEETWNDLLLQGETAKEKETRKDEEKQRSINRAIKLNQDNRKLLAKLANDGCCWCHC